MQEETRLTHYTLFTLGPCMALNHMYPTWSMYSNLSCSRQQGWAGPLLLRKRAPDTIYSTPADRSMSLYPVSLLSQPLKQQGKSQASVDGRLLGLLGPYHHNAIGTFNTYSRGPTHLSLTDTSGGYSLEGADFPHTTLRPSQLTVSTFHLRALLGHRLSNLNNYQMNLKREQTLNLMSGSLHSTSTVT
jgi:hypothetical protein